jgi:hypothetical protein
MSFISRRAIAAVAIATVATFPVIASAAQAATTPTKAAHSNSKPAKKFHAKFVLTGRVKAAGENSVTVTVKGGNLKKDVRGTDVVVAVDETTKITIGDDVKTLADVLVGDRVSVKGSRARIEGSTTYTAKRVHAKHPAVTTDSPPAPTASAVTT